MLSTARQAPNSRRSPHAHRRMISQSAPPGSCTQLHKTTDSRPGRSIRSGRNYFQKFGLFGGSLTDSVAPRGYPRSLERGPRVHELSHLFSDRSWHNELGKRGVLRCKAGMTDDPAALGRETIGQVSQLHARPDKSG
jgi:hypothetical protein